MIDIYRRQLYECVVPVEVSYHEKGLLVVCVASGFYISFCRRTHLYCTVFTVHSIDHHGKREFEYCKR
jgi:hypothetical protein